MDSQLTDCPNRSQRSRLSVFRLRAKQFLSRHAAKNGEFMHGSTSNQALPGTLSSRMLLLQLCFLTVFLHSACSYVSAPLSKVCTKDSDLFKSITDLQQGALYLEGSGVHSAARLWANVSDPPCTLIIKVPNDTHVIAVSVNNLPKGPFCPLNLWFVDGPEEPWTLNMCHPPIIEHLKYFPEIYGNRIALRWYPEVPLNKFEGNGSQIENVEIVVTAVGRGSTCEGNEWVLCWKNMKERLCIAKELACDGYLNCPRPANDESPSQCSNTDDVLKSTPSRAWDMVTTHFHKILMAKDVQFGEKIAEKVAKKKMDESAEERESYAEADIKVFPRFGTWTLVLLVMLACGLLLLLCGLWECCCRTQHPNISMSPRGSTVVATGGATVYIISSSPPPQYDDLEQPPDYKELFPSRSRSTAV